eukprot:sb/3468686/
MKDMLRMSQRLSKLDTEITRKSTNLSKTKTLSTSIQLEGELRELERKRNDVKKRISELESTGLSEDDQREMERLNEELEIAECAISFRDSLLENGSEGVVQERPINLPVTERITTVLFNKLLQERREKERVAAENMALVDQIKQDQDHLQTLNKTLISTDLEDPKVIQLERDVNYYKQLTNTLKKRLRNNTNAPDAPSQTPRTTVGEGALTPVRKSKKELRPLTAEEVFNRTPGRGDDEGRGNPACATSFA